jgi:hypothetical protein
VIVFRNVAAVEAPSEGAEIALRCLASTAPGAFTGARAANVALQLHSTFQVRAPGGGLMGASPE